MSPTSPLPAVDGSTATKTFGGIISSDPAEAVFILGVSSLVTCELVSIASLLLLSLLIVVVVVLLLAAVAQSFTFALALF